VANVPTAANPEGEEIVKYYTPITSCEDFVNDVTFGLLEEN